MSNNSSLIKNFLFGQETFTSKVVNIPLLLVRFYFGFTIMKAGLDKLPLPDWMTEQVVSMGFPFPVFFAWVASFGEFAFGALLCLGLMTRFSGLMLAIIMGVASFGVQQVLPLWDMHIAQMFFWVFAFYAFVGGGKYALDYLIMNQGEVKNRFRWSMLALPVSVLLLGVGFYRELTPVPQEEKSETMEILSINVPGSFNNWDPAANEMQKMDDNSYVLDMQFDQSSLIEFKFTANESWDINLGERDQPSEGFPISGTAEMDGGNDTENIKAYIPAAGAYRIKLDATTYQYTVTATSPTIGGEDGLLTKK
ncbi:MAG: DoxX family membrane protein [Saprospiraceae bacterium]|nr:DoxX family membrane protein [Saprospiraceae bacterium]